MNDQAATFEAFMETNAGVAFELSTKLSEMSKTHGIDQRNAVSAVCMLLETMLEGYPEAYPHVFKLMDDLRARVQPQRN